MQKHLWQVMIPFDWPEPGVFVSPTVLDSTGQPITAQIGGVWIEITFVEFSYALLSERKPAFICVRVYLLVPTMVYVCLSVSVCMCV
jgi:hypothetical protein